MRNLWWQSERSWVCVKTTRDQNEGTQRKTNGRRCVLLPASPKEASDFRPIAQSAVGPFIPIQAGFVFDAFSHSHLSAARMPLWPQRRFASLKRMVVVQIKLWLSGHVIKSKEKHALCCVLLCLHHSPWEIVDPYPVLVNHNAGGHHPDKNLCVALVLQTAGREKRPEKSCRCK